MFIKKLLTVLILSLAIFSNTAQAGFIIFADEEITQQPTTILQTPADTGSDLLTTEDENLEKIVSKLQLEIYTDTVFSDYDKIVLKDATKIFRNYLVSVTDTTELSKNVYISHQEGIWKRGVASVFRGDIPLIFESFISQEVDNTDIIYFDFQDNEEIKSLKIPASILDADAYKYWDIEEKKESIETEVDQPTNPISLKTSVINKNLISLASYDVSGFALPWAQNEAWSYTGAPHYHDSCAGLGGEVNCYNTTLPRNALDFSKAGGKIRAVADGKIDFNPATPSVLKIVHQNGLSTVYLHFEPIRDGRFKNGDFIRQGTVIATQGGYNAAGTSEPFAKHLHIAFLKDDLKTYLDIVDNGLKLGGWSFTEHARMYDGCAVKGSETKCAYSPYPTITNDGTGLSLQCPNQFKATYFNDREFVNQAGENCTGNSPNPADMNNITAIHSEWGGNGPGFDVDGDTFSIRYEGSFYFPSEDYYYFLAENTDDRIRLWSDGNLVLDNWSGTAVRNTGKEIGMGAGWHNIKVEFQEDRGGARLQLKWFRLGRNNFTAEFFNGFELQRPYLIHLGGAGSRINQNFGGGSPDWKVQTDNFSARYFGHMDFGQSGRYKFTVGGDDYIDLYIDGNHIGGTAWHNKDLFVDLSAGWHYVELTMKEGVGDARAYLDWWWQQPTYQTIKRKNSNHYINGYYTYDQGIVNMWSGDGSNDQKWEISGNQIKRYGTNLCLGHYGAASGSARLLNCNTNDTNQQWEFVGNLIRKKNTNYCLNSYSHYNGSKLNLYSCNSTDGDQLWVRQ